MRALSGNFFHGDFKNDRNFSTKYPQSIILQKFWRTKVELKMVESKLITDCENSLFQLLSAELYAVFSPLSSKKSGWAIRIKALLSIFERLTKKKTYEKPHFSHDFLVKNFAKNWNMDKISRKSKVVSCCFESIFFYVASIKRPVTHQGIVCDQIRIVNHRNNYAENHISDFLS